MTRRWWSGKLSAVPCEMPCGRVVFLTPEFFAMSFVKLCKYFFNKRHGMPWMCVGLGGGLAVGPSERERGTHKGIPLISVSFIEVRLFISKSITSYNISFSGTLWDTCSLARLPPPLNVWWWFYILNAGDDGNACVLALAHPLRSAKAWKAICGTKAEIPSNPSGRSNPLLQQKCVNPTAAKPSLSSYPLHNVIMYAQQNSQRIQTCYLVLYHVDVAYKYLTLHRLHMG